MKELCAGETVCTPTYVRGLLFYDLLTNIFPDTLVDSIFYLALPADGPILLPTRR